MPQETADQAWYSISEPTAPWIDSLPLPSVGELNRDTLREFEAESPSPQYITEPGEMITLGGEASNTEVGNPKKIDPQPINRNSQHWTLGIILLTLIIIAYTRTVSDRRFKQLFNAFISNRFVDQMIREEQIFSSGILRGLTLVFWLTASLFLAQTIERLDVQTEYLPQSEIALIGYSGLAILIYYTIKILFIRVSGLLFQVRDAMAEYTFNLILFNIVLGMVLIPVIVLSTLVPQFAHLPIAEVGLGLIALFYLARISRVLYLGSQTTTISKFYIILYLCTLEILPVLILGKLIIQQNPDGA